MPALLFGCCALVIGAALPDTITAVTAFGLAGLIAAGWTVCA